jgi:hypothetical protein
MRITKIGKDYITINEESLRNEDLLKINRIHIIKLDFKNPTYDLIKIVLNLFTKTNRFVIEDNIKKYNYILKKTEKKYYVMNREGSNIISFLRKNNKILLNFMNMPKEERNFFLMDGIFEDSLKNAEVIAINKKIYDEKIEVLDKYSGNVILINGDDKI